VSTFVLVHGAWHGAWCWERVAPLLVARGHDVVAPDLTGLGGRVDLASPTTGLGCHVDDVVAAVDGLAGPAGDAPDAGVAGDDVVLVGHSYGGLVAQQAADRRPDLVDRLVLLDAWLAPDGRSLFDQAPDWFVAWSRDSATAAGDGWRIPPPPAATVGVDDPADAAWLAARMVAQPLATFADPTRLTGAVGRVATSAVVTRPGNGIDFAAMADAHGITPHELASRHDSMVTDPDALAETLVRLAGGGGGAERGGAPPP
jgi:pimeloyl-ACP methyl ester carboxylesterase